MSCLTLGKLMQVLLQGQRLKIAESLAETPVLVDELQAFKVKITDAGNDTYGEWRGGKHDDLVLAIALTVWMGLRYRRISVVQMDW